MDAFDSDVLIYAAVPGHPLGERIASLFTTAAPGAHVGTGSVLLLPEVLSKPLRDGTTEEVVLLAGLLSRLDLRAVDLATTEVATGLATKYRLGAADATHLACAVTAGAERFITNNSRDFSDAITEVTITFPAALGGDQDAPPRPRVGA